MEFLHYFLYFWAIFALLYLDPDPADQNLSGSGSRTLQVGAAPRLYVPVCGVGHVRADPAVGLSIHGLWPQCGRHQEYLLSGILAQLSPVHNQQNEYRAGE
jgi:hypothetical protein